MEQTWKKERKDENNLSITLILSSFFLNLNIWANWKGVVK